MTNKRHCAKCGSSSNLTEFATCEKCNAEAEKLLERTVEETIQDKINNHFKRVN